ncbi:MAG: capsule assembly Wzi family protein [Terriglobales bacterium]
MRNRISVTLLLALFAAQLCLAAEAGPTDANARTAAAKHTCTDLSGKHAVPCPGEPASAATPTASGEKATAKSSVQPIGTQLGRGHAASQPTQAAAAPVESQPAATEVSAVTPAPTPSVAAPSSPSREPHVQPIGAQLSPRSSTPADVSPVALTAVQPATPLAPVYGTPVHTPSLERSLPLNFLRDQRNFWTTPFHLHLNDASWLIPFGGITAGLIAADSNIENRLPTSPSLISRSKSGGTYGAAAFAGGIGGAYLFSRFTGNARMRETSVLSGEAAVNTIAVTYAIKSLTQRDRPLEGDGTGSFFSHGGSFPSEHSAAAWSIASVVAHEYSSPVLRLLAYGSATAMTASRVIGRQHFASDAFVGSALGWYIGRQVYRAHHDQDERYGTFERAPRNESGRDPANMGSSFVPVDSWVYPAIDRLAAMGYIRSAFAGLRPWTRLECARLLEEAAVLESGSGSTEAERLYGALKSEFLMESGRRNGEQNLGAELESVYTRFTNISGPPLTDGYHFGQTIINDYGRPYQQGANLITGFSSRASAGPFSFYVRGEYQHAPSAPGYPQSINDFIGLLDENPAQPAMPIAARNNYRLLDTYVGITLRGTEISFGKQTLSWGPTRGGALMFSGNAEPFYMFRVTQVTPFKLPSLFGLLGPMKTEFFLGRLAGHSYPARPYIDGQKISFKPTPNLEFGFSKIDVFGRAGTPITWTSFRKSVFDYGAQSAAANANQPGIDPGDRRGGFDFSYRIPGLRDWLTLYSDSLADDDPSPLASPRRSAFNPGIYLSHFPGVPKLDLRLEAVDTDTSNPRSCCGVFIYWNEVYHDSHTNKGFLMGSWIGREGRGLQATTTYWFSPQNTLRLGYRNGAVSKDFVFPAGGQYYDFWTRGDWLIRPDLSFTGSFQYEHWAFPVLAPGPQSNKTLSFELNFHPHWGLRPK